MELGVAWIKAEVASRQSQTLGDKAWKDVKTSCEKVSHDLAEVWQKIHPGDK